MQQRNPPRSATGQSYSTVIGSIQYVCQAQGNMINQSLLLLHTGQPQTTRIFEMQCNSGSWNGDTSGGLHTPPNSVIGAPTRTNCSQCRNGFGGDTRCRA